MFKTCLADATTSVVRKLHVPVRSGKTHSCTGAPPLVPGGTKTKADARTGERALDLEIRRIDAMMIGAIWILAAILIALIALGPILEWLSILY